VPEDLPTALAEIGVTLPAEQLAQVDAYRAALWEWNEKINLTRHTTFEKFAARDVFDTLRLAEQLKQGERVLDVGSGGGVPGLILAIVRPDLRVSVCDSVGKKARVLEDLVTRLGLPVKVYATGVQDVLALVTFDLLVARAVAPLHKLLTWFKPQADAFDRALLIKGRSWPEEEAEAKAAGSLRGWRLKVVAEYTTPQSEALSVILELAK